MDEGGGHSGSPLSLTLPYLAFTPVFLILIGFGYGWLIFREKDIPVRLIGTVLMVAGAALITVWGN